MESLWSSVITADPLGFVRDDNLLGLLIWRTIGLGVLGVMFRTHSPIGDALLGFLKLGLGHGRCHFLQAFILIA